MRERGAHSKATRRRDGGATVEANMPTGAGRKRERGAHSEATRRRDGGATVKAIKS